MAKKPPKKHAVTRRAINLHRTIKGTATEVRQSAVDLVRAASVTFAKLDGSRFPTVQKGVVDLLENGMGTMEALIRQRAIDVADANTPQRMTKKKIDKLLKGHIAVAGTLDE